MEMSSTSFYLFLVMTYEMLSHRTVNGLVGCLYEYLNLSPEQCHFQKVRISNMKVRAVS